MDTSLDRKMPDEFDPAFTSTPSGHFLLKCTAATAERFTKRGGKGDQLIVRTSFKVVEPVSHRDSDHRETFWLGNDEDPMAESTETIKKTGRGLNSMAEAMGVKVTGSTLQVVLSEVLERKVVGRINSTINPENPDFPNTRINKWLKEGANGITLGPDNVPPSEPRRGRGATASPPAPSAAAKLGAPPPGV